MTKRGKAPVVRSARTIFADSWAGRWQTGVLTASVTSLADKEGLSTETVRKEQTNWKKKTSGRWVEENLLK